MTDFLQSISPSDPKDVIGEFAIANAAAVDAAVARAREAFASWRDCGFEKRAARLKRFRDLVAAHQEELARLIAREVGKAIWDARAEASLIATKVDLTLGEGMQQIAPLQISEAIQSSFFPRGVFAVLGPFNFPAHLPNGQIASALATGNCVIFKPSDLAPAVGEWLVGQAHAAGIPRDVLQLVQGHAETGKLLARHPGIDGILFTGSYTVGRQLQELTLDQPWKILALEMGGKNAMIVADDADLQLAVAEAALSIAATTGQRCTATSRIFVQRKLESAFCDKLNLVLRGLRIGNPLDEATFMGPLVSKAAHEKVLRFRAQAEAAGGERILQIDLDLPAPFIAPALTRFRGLAQTHPYQREEIFAPEAAIYAYDELDEAIAAVNDSDYGLAAALISRDVENYNHCLGKIRTGIFNWNRGTIGASGRLPFGGIQRSGNDRPAGIASTVFCVVPQAHLKNSAGFDPRSLPPGISIAGAFED